MPRSRTPKGRRQAESRHSCIASNESPPTHKTSATAARCNKFIPPQTQKTSPMTPPLSKSETNLRFLSGGDMGEVLGERGRFGGREPPLRKSGLSPSKVFPLTLPEYQTHNVPTGDGIPRASEDRRSSNRCQPACNQRLHRSRTAESDRNRALSRSVARARSASS